MQTTPRPSPRLPGLRRCCFHATPASAIAVAAMLFALGGCATPGPVQTPSAAAAQGGRQEIAAALQEGKSEAARKLLASALRAEPQNGYLHLLNGLSYQLTDASQQSAELAQVGYDAASKFAPGYYWSHYYSGLARFNRHDYAAAAEDFAWAILDRPDAPHAFAGLAAAAYYAGDLGVARVAAERALALAPHDPAMLRTSAYVAAASGHRRQVALLMEKADALSPASSGLSADKPRLAQLLRTATLAQAATPTQGEQAPAPDAQPPQAPPPTDAAAYAGGLQQVMVEVTLLLSQDATKHSVGINLLDGLKLQFGGDNKTERRGGTGVADTFSRVITTALSVPQITYSLNLFNTHDDFYDVVVRPSLVATLGQQSEFFIGRTLSVGVSGINAGTLHTIDVGTSVKLSPLEITPERTRFRVDTVRSFFVPTSSGTFTESVTTFKQTVGATAEVEFGKTLILSGLYEAVNVGWTSKVPLLGDIPVANLLFNERSKTETRDAAIVLVTPRLTSTLDTGTREFRAETLKKLLSLWTELVDPLANTDALTERIRGSISRHFAPQRGDLRLPAASDPALARQAIGETLARLH
jgi:Flp pilus assembly protein TadD